MSDIHAFIFFSLRVSDHDCRACLFLLHFSDHERASIFFHYFRISVYERAPVKNEMLKYRMRNIELYIRESNLMTWNAKLFLRIRNNEECVEILSLQIVR